MTALSQPVHPNTKLAEIPWDQLPLTVQATYHRFIDAWWDQLDPDQPLEASGLGNMTLAEIQELHQRERDAQTGPRYRLITFMRIDPEENEPLTYEQALSEKDQQDLMCTNDIHRIEEIPHP